MNSPSAISSGSIPGLSQHQCEKITGVFSGFDTVQGAVLYGSRAQDRHRHGSDIDIALLGEIDQRTRYAIIRALDDLLLPWEIDLSVYHEIENSRLREHIDRVGKEIYRKPTGTGESAHGLAQ